jgi:hypothetical protein
MKPQFHPSADNITLRVFSMFCQIPQAYKSSRRMPVILPEQHHAAWLGGN